MTICHHSLTVEDHSEVRDPVCGACNQLFSVVVFQQARGSKTMDMETRRAVESNWVEGNPINYRTYRHYWE